MVMELGVTLRGRLERWAHEGYPQERCVLLLGRVSLVRRTLLCWSDRAQNCRNSLV